MAQQRLQLDRVRQDLPTSPMGLLTRAPGMSGKWLQRMVLWPPGRAVPGASCLRFWLGGQLGF